MTRCLSLLMRYALRASERECVCLCLCVCVSVCLCVSVCASLYFPPPLCLHSQFVVDVASGEGERRATETKPIPCRRIWCVSVCLCVCVPMLVRPCLPHKHTCHEAMWYSHHHSSLACAAKGAMENDDDDDEFGQTLWIGKQREIVYPAVAFIKVRCCERG